MEDKSCREQEILIIDDTPGQIHLVASVLREQNYKVKVLIDAKKVLESLNKSVPDLILMDIMMPDINGIELCKSIKSDLSYSSIPIIFLTAVTDSETIINAFSSGAQDYVSKPVNPKELLARVEVHLQLKCKTERLEGAYREIESFNHMVSHDLKSPLWAIKNLVGFLNDEYLQTAENDARRFLVGLGEKASEAIILIEKLSELSKISSDPLTKEKVNIYVLFNEVYKTLSEENSGRIIEFSISQMPEVIADKLLIRQVIYNAMSNAFKYSSKREISIINVEYIKKDDEHIFVISDNGAGFSVNNAERLFSMFSRFHAKKDFEGTGTGLAIAKKIIERHFGKVWIESEVDKGTNFYFSLPV